MMFVNFGVCLVYIGKRVLLVDIDLQGNVISGLGIEKVDVEQCVYDILVDDVDVIDIIKVMIVENLDVIFVIIQFVGVEIELVLMILREVRLKRVFEVVKQNYDYIIIDCLLLLGLLMINVFIVLDFVVIFVQCEYYVLEGFSQLLNIVCFV